MRLTQQVSIKIHTQDLVGLDWVQDPALPSNKPPDAGPWTTLCVVRVRYITAPYHPAMIQVFLALVKMSGTQLR